MSAATDFAREWAGLPSAARRALELAHLSLVSGGLACGAALADRSGAVVAEGRNHEYDPPGGPDVLQGTPLAHAELNVLAAVPTDRELGDCALWSTQEPCSMCTAAIAFVGVGTVRYLAPDPWAVATDRSRFTACAPALDDGRWLVAANVLFLLSIARSRGLDHPTVARNGEREPETAAIVRDLAGAAEPPERASAFLVTWWNEAGAAADHRAARLTR